MLPIPEASEGLVEGAWAPGLGVEEGELSDLVEEEECWGLEVESEPGQQGKSLQ